MISTLRPAWPRRLDAGHEPVGITRLGADLATVLAHVVAHDQDTSAGEARMMGSGLFLGRLSRQARGLPRVTRAPSPFIRSQ